MSHSRRLFGETRLLPESATTQLPELESNSFKGTLGPMLVTMGKRASGKGGGAQEYSHSEEACRERSMSHRQSCRTRFTLFQFEITTQADSVPADPRLAPRPPVLVPQSQNPGFISFLTTCWTPVELQLHQSSTQVPLFVKQVLLTS